MKIDTENVYCFSTFKQVLKYCPSVVSQLLERGGGIKISFSKYNLQLHNVKGNATLMYSSFTFLFYPVLLPQPQCLPGVLFSVCLPGNQPRNSPAQKPP